MAHGDELNVGAAAAGRFDALDDMADVLAHLIVLIEPRIQPVQPAEVGLPVAEIVAIAAAKRDDDLATAAAHAPPDVKLEAADQPALRIARRARQEIGRAHV